MMTGTSAPIQESAPQPEAAAQVETQTSQPPILLPEHTEAPRRSLQYLSGVAALVLIFFASASLTVAYLSGSQPAAAGQAAAAAANDPFSGVMIEAQGAYVIDLTTNRVLYSKNPDIQLPLASLTKVALALAVSGVLKPEMDVTIPEHTTPDGAPIRLPAGLRFEVRDLIDFTLVASSNEGASILADAAEDALRATYPEAVAGASALWRMNDIAKNLGLRNTFFLNTSGLDLSPTQAGAYGSAHDVALLFGHAASTASDVFGHTSRDRIEIRATSGETVSGVNTDEALPAIPGLIMGKTGFTELAGGNLAILFEVGPTHPVVAVVLHSTRNGRFEDMKKLVAATQDAVAAGQ